MKQREAGARPRAGPKRRPLTRAQRRRAKFAAAAGPVMGLLFGLLIQVCHDDAQIAPSQLYAGPPPTAASSAAGSDGWFTGFVFSSQLVDVDEQHVRLVGFDFRPTRRRYRAVDFHGDSSNIECTYRRESYAVFAGPPRTLVSFAATQGPNDRLLLTSCPQDALTRGNLDAGR